MINEIDKIIEQAQAAITGAESPSDKLEVALSTIASMRSFVRYNAGKPNLFHVQTQAGAGGGETPAQALAAMAVGHIIENHGGTAASTEAIDEVINDLAEGVERIVLKSLQHQIAIIHARVGAWEDSPEHTDGGVPIADLMENEYHDHINLIEL